ncbi:hypothetical protein [Tomitella cavernea]|uniref:Integrase catalytic domain-containing protein n=1 Tax=Tomitella cavernea TaxID=1387982 RepID=A0ABP9CSQ9_9ACTN|nr:hypothetical protein [Tomitella cavernea]
MHILSGLDAAVASVPFMITGLDFENGSEFINDDVIGWAAGRDIFFTRSRPYKKNDQATTWPKNNHLVRRYGFYWRYDTPEALKLLNALWPLVGDRMNYFTPTKKPIGWTTDAAGRRKRVYDAPATPLERLLDAGALSPAQEAELIAYRDSLNPAAHPDHPGSTHRLGPRCHAYPAGPGHHSVAGHRTRREDPAGKLASGFHREVSASGPRIDER